MTTPSFILEENEIHFWYFDLDLFLDRWDEFRALLDPIELAKETEFYFEKDKKRYVLSRGFLRKILARYLHQDPKQIFFSKNRFGKPFISSPSEVFIYFNLSHSANLAFIAISKNLEIGVDIEKMREDRRIEKIVEKYFSEEEKKYLLTDGKIDLKKFYQIWTCKEAFIKGIGEGLHFPLKEVNFSIQENPFLIRLKKTKLLEKFSSWSVEELDCPLKLGVTAFAVQANTTLVKIYHWINPSL